MKKFVKAVFSWIILSLIVIAVSGYFLFNEFLIGIVYIILGIIILFSLRFFKIEIKTVYPDLVFGAIDNGFLILAAVIGGTYGGVAGAVIGGAAGNTITDGIGGLFEGKVAEKLRRKAKKYQERSSLSTMLGKMIGCLLGAGGAILIMKGILLTGKLISNINLMG
ncbi:hypothetical protein HOD29_03890 [archaeon]|jgi:hypothetical protein|nr:hypothetical protein [archaeon]